MSTRPPDPIFDTVVDLWYGGKVSQTTRGIANRAVKEFKELDATPDEIRLRYKRHKQLWPDIHGFGPMSVVKHWHTLSQTPKPRYNPDDDIDPFTHEPRPHPMTREEQAVQEEMGMFTIHNEEERQDEIRRLKACEESMRLHREGEARGWKPLKRPTMPRGLI